MIDLLRYLTTAGFGHFIANLVVLFFLAALIGALISMTATSISRCILASWYSSDSTEAADEEDTDNTPANR